MRIIRRRGGEAWGKKRKTKLPCLEHIRARSAGCARILYILYDTYPPVACPAQGHVKAPRGVPIVGPSRDGIYTTIDSDGTLPRPLLRALHCRGLCQIRTRTLPLRGDIWSWFFGRLTRVWYYADAHAACSATAARSRWGSAWIALSTTNYWKT